MCRPAGSRAAAKTRRRSTPLFLDALAGEEHYRLEPKDNRTPEQLFERRWALALLDRVLARLREEPSGSDRTALFEALQPFLAAKEGGDTYAVLAVRFGRTITQAEWVKELKRVSNLWLKERGRDYANFERQGGYADFSVSQSNLEQVKQYIAEQEERHRKIGFQDELRALLGFER